MMRNSLWNKDLFDGFMNDMFEDDFFGGKNPLYGKNARNMMKTDIRETDEGYELDIDLPGFKKDEIQAELKNGYLTRTELLFFNCVLSFLYTLNNVENKYPIKIPHQKELMAQKVKNFLELNFYRNFTTKEVSQALYLSERQLNRIFQSEYHMTMHDYLQKLRVNHAKLLMQESRYNMKEVAFLCGFSGYQQLHRALIADTSS